MLVAIVAFLGQQMLQVVVLKLTLVFIVGKLLVFAV